MTFVKIAKKIHGWIVWLSTLFMPWKDYTRWGFTWRKRRQGPALETGALVAEERDLAFDGGVRQLAI